MNESINLTQFLFVSGSVVVVTSIIKFTYGISARAEAVSSDVKTMSTPRQMIPAIDVVVMTIHGSVQQSFTSFFCSPS